jgi:Chitobiase/beta-hexosaminidase C-terminal domain
MASHSVAAGEIGVHAKTLAAATVDTVTFDRDCDSVEVENETGAGVIYFTVDGSTPTVAGANTYRVSDIKGMALQVPVYSAGDTVVKLIGSAETVYSVTGSLRPI